MTWPRPIRVIAIGSPLGDDALAWEVVGHLQQKAWPHGIEFQSLAGGQQLLDVLDGRGSLVLIDALGPAGNPGMARRLDWPDPSLEVLRPGSTHQLRPAEVLELASALGILPAQVAIHAVEGEAFDPGCGLSPKVIAAVGELVRRIGAELEEHIGRDADDHEPERAWPGSCQGYLGS
jgi:hydrogenase maturation protease